LGNVTESNCVLVGCALALCGGTILYISCSDLLPELLFHALDRVKLSLALAAGLGISILVGQFETDGHAPHSGHAHQAGEAQAESVTPK
jgi:hypothetical protein